MAILPVPLARVSTLLQGSVATSAIARVQEQLLQTENQISTGKRVNTPSDDPGASSVILQLNQTLSARQAFATNLQAANSQLSETDSALSGVSDALLQAQNLASANVSSTVNPDQRAAAADQVKTLENQLLSLGNTSINGFYIFGGSRSTTPPFVSSSAGIQFVGASNILTNTVDENSSLPLTVNGDQVFGATSARVTGTVNLNPVLTATTRLSDLGGFANDGVHVGSIVVSNNGTSAVIDLQHADAVGDVISAINSAGVPGVTANITGSGIAINGSGGNLQIGEAGGGSAAADLGILGTSVGGSVGGANVHARVTPFTTLASLRGGLGIDPAGLQITNGLQSATITVGPGSTVEDLLNAINGSKTGVLARINASGTGIDIVNPTQGTDLTIAENGGTTAADLGVRSFHPASALADLNNGNGVHTVAGGDFTVTRKDGSVFTVSLAAANTVQDVINSINAADGGAGVTASFATTGNGIVLTDGTGGGGTLSVSAINASTAAADLGLNTVAVGNTLTGRDANPVAANSIFSHLQQLEKALRTSDPNGITSAAGGLQDDYKRVTAIRGQAGAQIKEISGRQSSMLDENVATQSLLSQLQDTDLTSAISQFQQLQTALQASLATASKVLHLSLLDFLN